MGTTTGSNGAPSSLASKPANEPAQVPSQSAAAIAAKQAARNTPRKAKQAAQARKASAKPTKPRYAPTSTYGGNAVITVLCANPKRGASFARFAKYGKPGSKLSVETALKRGVWRADLSWDLAHGFIAIKNAAKAARVPKAAKANEPAQPAKQVA